MFAAPTRSTAGVLLAALMLVVASCSSARTSSRTAARTGARRAILVSFDALNERRALTSVPHEVIPNFVQLFSAGACAASARPAFPSVTAPGHAALWTGAYGNVNGISANAQPRLPRSEHTLLSNVSGYLADGLRAEPLWITAARAGVRVAAHHVTQAPGAPGYHGTDAREPALDAERAEAEAILGRSNLLVMNGYNVSLAPSILLTEARTPPRTPGNWRGLATLPTTVPPRELVWAAGTDSMFALLYGTGRYDRVLLAGRRDVAAGTTAIVAATDPLLSDGERQLARHFAPPRIVQTARGTISLTGRLFSLAGDGSRFELFIPEMRVVEANNTQQLQAYLNATGGWFGNAGKSVYTAGQFGPPVREGGDGLAERRFLETAELLTRQYMRGAEWLWRERAAELLVDYFPLIDEIEHEWYGLVDSTTALHDASLAARLAPYRNAAWNLADRRLGALYALLDADAGSALIVSGDHGMRSYWKRFRPNVALQRAGLLVLDGSGRVDLSRTRAYSPNGYYVMLNRVAWREGIVRPEAERALTDSVVVALRAARGEDGGAIVVRTWRSDAPGADSLGLGGPAGGDVYYDVAPSYYWSSGSTGELTSPMASPLATHGFPSTSPEMHTVLCLWGPGVSPRRIGAARNADAALVSADWLGIPRPANATGRSPYSELISK